MRNTWILDVLTDLKAYADHNGLDATMAALDDAALVAMAELSSLEGHVGLDAPVWTEGEPVEAGHWGPNVTDLGAYRAGG